MGCLDMKITVLGSTGSTGQLVVQGLLKENHDVVAYVRNPSKMNISADRLTVVEGEIYDRSLMSKTIEGSDAVISCLGSSTTGKSEELSLMAASIIHVLKEANIPKVIYMSTAGIEDEFQGFMKWFIGMILGNVIKDHKAAANLYRHSGITYVLARPMQLKDGKASLKYHMAEEGLPKSRKAISRANVADFLVKAAVTSAYDNKSIALAE